MPSRARRIVRKTLRWTLRVVLALLLLVLVVLVLVLYSPGFLHLVINVGLGFYNDRIPGEIRVGRVEGRLADHLVLGDIYLEDGDGRVLIAARELALTWTPWDLLHKAVTVERLELHDGQVHLVPGGFGDLAMPGPEKPPRKTVLPDLPLDIRVAALEVDNVDVLKGTGETIVGAARLSARDLGWKGMIAHLKIDDGAAALNGVAVEALALEADWSEPKLALTGLVTTDLAIVELVEVDFDAKTLDGDVLVAVDGRRGALAGKLKGALADKLRDAPGDPTVRVRVAGKSGDLAVGVSALVPGLGALDLSASGNPLRPPDVQVQGRLAADLGQILPPPHGEKFGLVRPNFAARITGSDWQQLSAELRLACPECGALSGLDLTALARNDAILSDAAASVKLSGAGIALHAEVRSGPLGPEAAYWDIRSKQVEEPLGIARLFVDLPPISGELATHGSCTGSPLRCEGFVDVDGFRGFKLGLTSLRVHAHGQPLAPVPVATATVSARDLRLPGYRFAGVEVSASVGPSKDVAPDVDHPHGVLEAAVAAEAWVTARDKGDRAKVAARVRPGPPLTIFLEALDVRMRGLQALLSRPARVAIAGRRFDIKDLALLAAGGQIGVDGRADLDGTSDLAVAIDHVKLAPIVALVPSLRGQLSGTINSRATLKGAAQAPELSLQLGGQRLRFRKGALGDLDVGVSVGGGKGRAVVSLVGTMAETFVADAQIPLTADLSKGKFAVKQGGMHLGLDIKKFRLASLDSWLNGELGPRGLVDVKVAVDGPASKPSTKVMVRGRGLMVSKEPPASLDLEFEQKADEDAVGRLDIGRLGGRLRLNVTQLPARINLVDGGVKWRPEQRHAFTIVARDIDLWRQLNDIMPGHYFAGQVELEGGFDGPMTDPDLKLAVKGSGLRLRDGQIGKLRLDLRLHDQRATVDLKVNGSVAREVGLHAEAPLHVDLAHGKVRWLKDEAHVLDARVKGFELGTLKELGFTAAWTGNIDVAAKLSGSATVPVFNVDTDMTEIVWKDRRVGTAHVDVDYAERRVKAGVQAQLGNGTVNVKASAPLAADLGRGKVEWDKHGEHDVEVRVDNLDRTMLAPLGRVPEEALLELSLIARAKGNLADFKADLQAHGQMGHKLIGGAPLHIVADVDPHKQSLKFSIGPHKWAGEVGVKVDAKADIMALAQGRAKADDIPFTAAVRAPKFDTRFAQAFVPKNLYDINGELSATVDASGKVGAPDVRGELHLRRGSITVLELQQRIREITLDVAANGRTITVEKLAATSGKGRLDGTATVELPRGGGMKLVSEVKLRRFPLVRPGLPQMQIDTHVNAKVNSTAEETAVGLQIGGTRVYVTGYTADPPKQIPENPNVTYRDEKERVAVATDQGPDGDVTAENEVVRPKDEDEAKAGKRFAMRIKLVDPVDIRGPGTEMTWQGSVAATREGEQREVTGKLTAKEGRLDLLGNRFKIESGSVTLPEDEDTVDPFINVVAGTTTASFTVKATFRGRLTRPELIFSSEPALTQSQILTLLLTGAPDATEADEDRVLAQAAALLATFQNPALSSFLSSRLGIDHVGLSFGDDVNQPILSVGKNLTKNIYVETAYKVNAPRNKNKVEARVEYEFKPRWTLETYFGDAAVGGVDVFWRKMFGKPRRLPEHAGKPTPRGTAAGDSPRGTGGDTPSGSGSSGGAGGGAR